MKLSRIASDREPMPIVNRKLKIVKGRWLPDMDLNHDKQIQSLLCYRYTIGQAGASDRLKGFTNPSSQQTTGVSLFDNRPHPGPLPQERGNHSPVVNNTGNAGCREISRTNYELAAAAIGTADFSQGARGHSLSPGERAGVRAVVTTNFPVSRITHHVSRN